MQQSTKYAAGTGERARFWSPTQQHKPQCGVWCVCVLSRQKDEARSEREVVVESAACVGTKIAHARRAAAGVLAFTLLSVAEADFKLPAGNWTHSTSLFANYHFVPGYNQAGEWDLLTGGNWTPTNHSDANLIGDAEIYLCPCPDPPCDEDPEPEKPGFTTSVFGCVDQETLNITHAVCTVFHATKTNVTCVTPDHSIACDVPGFESNGTLVRWWENDELPSRSYYSSDVTAISCVIRNLVQELPDRTSTLPRRKSCRSKSRSSGANWCAGACARRRAPPSTFPCTRSSPSSTTGSLTRPSTTTLASLWTTARSTRSDLRRSTCAARCITTWQERIPLNMTCTLPTLTVDKHFLVMGNAHPNLTATQGIFDMYGRRFNGQNIFDLSLYVALHSLVPLENKRCVTPFPNASQLDLLLARRRPTSTRLFATSRSSRHTTSRWARRPGAAQDVAW